MGREQPATEIGRGHEATPRRCARAKVILGVYVNPTLDSEIFGSPAPEPPQQTDNHPEGQSSPLDHPVEVEPTNIERIQKALGSKAANEMGGWLSAWSISDKLVRDGGPN
jgi:hypothetical protein